MKTFKIIFAAIIFAGFATSAMATGGQGDNASVEASAIILVPLTLDNNGTAVNFGAVQPGTQPVLNPANIDGDDDVEFAGIGERAVARFSVAGAAGANIQFSGDANLTLTNGEDNITYNPTFSWEAGDLTTVRGGTEYTLGADVNLDTNGEGTIWMGGDLGTVPQVSAGTYEGTYQLTVEYN